MENLNAEQVKKALECCLTTSEGDCIACGYRGKKDRLFITCTNILMADALALINKQETEYNELYELLQSYKGDSEAYRSYSKTLEEENKALKTLLDESYDTQNSLTEENERLRGILLQFTDIVHKWGNKNGYDTSEISLVPTIMADRIDQIAKEMEGG